MSKTINCGSSNGILGGKGFGTCQNDTVNNDKGDKYAQ